VGVGKESLIDYDFITVTPPALRWVVYTLDKKTLVKNILIRRLERHFRCCSVCETMADYKKGYLMVWASYYPCDSIAGLYFKGTCDSISVFVNYMKNYFVNLPFLFLCWKVPLIL